MTRPIQIARRYDPAPDERPLTIEAIRTICPECATKAEDAWGISFLRAVRLNDAVRTIFHLADAAFARMVATEHRLRPDPDHTRYLARAIAPFQVYLVAEHRYNVLAVCEANAIRFDDVRELVSLFDGLSNRFPSAVSLEQDQTFERLVRQFRPHLAEIPEAARHDPASAARLLLAIDLYANGGQRVPPCKCMRLAHALRVRKMADERSARLFAAFESRGRIDDLVALAEGRTTTYHLGRLLEQPQRIDRWTLERLRSELPTHDRPA